jgi:hypothetical protein
MMKRMLLMTVGLMLVCAVPAFAQKAKVKKKEKRFETVVAQAASDYAGRYAGFESGLLHRREGRRGRAVSYHELRRRAPG